MNAKDMVKKIAESLELKEETVISILGKDIISSLKTMKDAYELLPSCPSNMKTALLDRWKELAAVEISSIKTMEEGKALRNSCPDTMMPDLIKAMFKLEE